ncbi:MAG: T9SS type A sorting domain-containing protein [Bacteroidales bacterium]
MQIKEYIIIFHFCLFITLGINLSSNPIVYRNFNIIEFYYQSDTVWHIEVSTPKGYWHYMDSIVIQTSKTKIVYDILNSSNYYQILDTLLNQITEYNFFKLPNTTLKKEKLLIDIENDYLKIYVYKNGYLRFVPPHDRNLHFWLSDSLEWGNDKKPKIAPVSDTNIYKCIPDKFGFRKIIEFCGKTPNLGIDSSGLKTYILQGYLYDKYKTPVSGFIINHFQDIYNDSKIITNQDGFFSTKLVEFDSTISVNYLDITTNRDLIGGSYNGIYEWLDAQPYSIKRTGDTTNITIHLIEELPVKTMVENKVWSGDFTLFPNPTNRKATLQYNIPNTVNCQLFVRSTTGTLVHTAFFKNNSGYYDIPAKNLVPGIYIVQCIANGSVVYTNELLVIK